MVSDPDKVAVGKGRTTTEIEPETDELQAFPEV